MKNNANKLDWMMWFENENPKEKYPTKTLHEGIEYYTRKYRQIPNRALFPFNTDLERLQTDYQGLRLEASQMVLACHIHLTYDPGEKPPCS